ncbi:MAG: hypothetical protein IPN80_02845 [Flavobacterium sp.]|nr:hypothetical protein [Flavobacterium sp.]
MNASSFARIGINEPSPNAKLQINASNQANPNNSDGIIIPKVDTFPIINPGSLQNGMMVFLTTPVNKSGFYYWDNPSTSWKGIGANSGWGLTGNAGTSATTNFIGTTDDVDVVFKRNTLKSGLISINNTAFGQNAFSVNTTGTNNTANGVDALAAKHNGS